jgi:predicted nucleic acid-binding Zn ribbon protein
MKNRQVQGGNEMCIMKICKHCGDKFVASDMRRIVCQKPECQGSTKRRNWQRYAKLARIKSCHTHCTWCGEELVVGSRRMKFCSDKCRVENRADKDMKARQRKEYDKEYYARNKTAVATTGDCT